MNVICSQTPLTIASWATIRKYHIFPHDFDSIVRILGTPAYGTQANKTEVAHRLLGLVTPKEQEWYDDNVAPWCEGQPARKSLDRITAEIERTLKVPFRSSASNSSAITFGRSSAPGSSVIASSTASKDPMWAYGKIRPPCVASNADHPWISGMVHGVWECSDGFTDRKLVFAVHNANKIVGDIGQHYRQEIDFLLVVTRCKSCLIVDISAHLGTGNLLYETYSPGAQAQIYELLMMRVRVFADLYHEYLLFWRWTSDKKDKKYDESLARCAQCMRLYLRDDAKAQGQILDEGEDALDQIKQMLVMDAGFIFGDGETKGDVEDDMADFEAAMLAIETPRSKSKPSAIPKAAVLTTATAKSKPAAKR